MKKSTKIWMIVAASLVALGLAIWLVALALNNWSFVGEGDLTVKSYEIGESFEDIYIESKTADVIFLPSNDGVCRVECVEREKQGYSVSVEGGELRIVLEDTRDWFEHISLVSFGSAKITVYLPEGEYGKLTAKGITGDVEISGNFELEGIIVSVTTGDVRLKDVTVDRRIDIEITTGDVNFDNCDGGEIYVRSTTGDVTGTLLSEKTFYAHSTTGHVDVPETSGGRCEVSCTTGDIIIEVIKKK